MSISVACSECKSRSTFEDSWAGMRVTCGSCGAYLAIPAASGLSPEQVAAGPPPVAPPRPSGPPPLPSSKDWDTPSARYDFEEDYEVALRRPDDLAPGWRLVRIGLGMLLWAIRGNIAATLFFALFAAVTAVGGNAGGTKVSVIVFGVVLLGAALTGFVGMCLCIAAPPESRARGLAIGSVSALVLGVILYGVCILLLMIARNRFNQGPALMLVLMFGLLSVASALTGLVLFVQFMKAVAFNFRRNFAGFSRNKPFAQSANGFLMLSFVSGGLYLALLGFAFAVRDPQAGMAVGCFGLIIAVVGIILVLWFLRLLATARGCIE